MTSAQFVETLGRIEPTREVCRRLEAYRGPAVIRGYEAKLIAAADAMVAQGWLTKERPYAYAGCTYHRYTCAKLDLRDLVGRY